jgi:dTDP-glucose 4,6-dehydratase
VSSFTWSAKKVLVTGAGGFIGSHLTEALAARGAHVRALVRYNSQGTFGWLDTVERELRRSIEVHQGDLRDADRIYQAMMGVEIVFHLGAMISIPYSYVSPSEASAVNTQGTLNVLNAARRLGVAKIVHTSTSEVYGTAQYVPIDEKHPLQGQSPYSASKIAADQLAESYHRSFDVPVTTVRPFNTFGPRQSARAVIPTIAVQLLSGGTLKLGSLTPTRDLTFVSDTVNGMILAAERPASAGRTINLGTGREITIGDLASLIAKLVGREIAPTTEAARLRPEKSEVNRLLSNNAVARDVLGWQPEVSLEDGLKRTIAWLRENLGYYTRAATDYVV